MKKIAKYKTETISTNGSAVHAEAQHIAAFSHVNQLVWTAKDGRTYRAMYSAESLKRAVIGTGTQNLTPTEDRDMICVYSSSCQGLSFQEVINIIWHMKHPRPRWDRGN